jgi:hypothetical protein
MTLASSIQAALLSFIVASGGIADAAEAETSAGHNQYLCGSVDEFINFVIALGTVQDVSPYHCVGLAPGTRIVILRVIPTDVPRTAHYAQVKAYTLPNGGFIVGYTLVLSPTPTIR